jgi:hypothetical protein
VILMWPLVAAVGFVALAALVVALATSSTARYEFERNQVQGQRQPAPAVRTPVAAVAVAAAVGADSAAPAPAPQARPEPPATVAMPRVSMPSVPMPTHPAGKRGVERSTPPAWWLVEVSEDGAVERAVDGPFHDRIEADWAVLASDTTTRRAVYGALRLDGGVIRRQSPQEQAWLAELGEQLDRLPEDWDDDLTDADDDALVTLVVEVAAALVEAGLSVHDCAGDGPAGGVCLTPEPGRNGVLASWHQHDRMSREQVRGAETDTAVQRTMNAAVADCLRQMGFQVEAFGSTGCSLVTAAQCWW